MSRTRDKMTSGELKKFLLDKGFVTVGTCDKAGNPNAAPKYIIKIDRGHIYLADYVMGKTLENLKVNPRISLATMDMKTLEGWQINGTAMTITDGPEHEKLLKAMADQEARHTARRVIEDVRGTQHYDSYQIQFPEKVVMLKVTAEMVTKIGIRGELQSEKVQREK